MTEHLPECWLYQPCRSSDGPQHAMQESIAGIPVKVCGLCMEGCICERLRACEERVIAAAIQQVTAAEVPFDMDDRLRACEERVIAEAVQRIEAVNGDQP